ncbi:MAG: octanoyltransferase [Deltaproteobacteria bacterium]|jgi:lipoate-protein ligase B|nr:MAG: octanoyltransferase [Deltaproteobacteria bacterium]
MGEVRVCRLGTIHYREALELQMSLLEKRFKGEIGDVLLLLEHPPTFTIGRGGKNTHLLVNREELARRGIHFEAVSRGGDITYHGPGQLVGYPIVDLGSINRDIYSFLRNLEETIIIALGNFGLKARRIKGLTGVWVDNKKIASIGIGIKRWITYHGFALNVNTDLSYFNMIVPCGMQDVEITSIKELLGKDINMKEVEDSIVDAFAKVFNKRVLEASLDEQREIKA